MRNIYKGLSKIEETFKITKSEFNARPINVRLEEHIDAHFLICFISLIIIRILQKKVDEKYSLKNLISKIKKFQCTHEDGNLYKFIGYKPEIQYLNEKLNLNLDKKYDSRENIRKILKYWQYLILYNTQKRAHALFLYGFADFCYKTKD